MTCYKEIGIEIYWTTIVHNILDMQNSGLTKDKIVIKMEAQQSNYLDFE